MKVTSLSFLQSYLFDQGYHDFVTEIVQERGHLHGLRTTWKEAKLQNVPTQLFCNVENERTIWILVRNEGDYELRTAYPLDPLDDLEFDKFPQGIQRAIGIFFPKDNAPIGWRLFRDVVKGETSIEYSGGMKTFSKERNSIKHPNRAERHRKQQLKLTSNKVL